MLLRVGIVVALLIAAILVFASTRPNVLHIERSIVINAHQEKIFELINDLHYWKDWNQEDKEDPSVTRSFNGPQSGMGAASQWEGRGSSGKGQMSITESQTPSRVEVEVDFVKPFKSHNLNVFTIEPAGASTRVTWSWQGQNLFFMKVMGIFANMNKMIGQHFDHSLENLKAIAEKPEPKS